MTSGEEGSHCQHFHQVLVANHPLPPGLDLTVCWTCSNRNNSADFVKAVLFSTCNHNVTQNVIEKL